MCTDTDIATDLDTETFSWIGPWSDLYRTVRVNVWACLSFSSLLVPFPAILSCRWKSTCDPVILKISKITKDEIVEQLLALVRENVAFYDQSSDDHGTSSSLKQTSNNRFEWTGVMTDAGKKRGKCTALCMDKYNQRHTRFRMPLRANRVHIESFCRTPWRMPYPYPYPYPYPFSYKWTRALSVYRFITAGRLHEVTRNSV